MTDVERFVAAIRESIEAQLYEQSADNGGHDPMVERITDTHLIVDGGIDLDQLARAAHAAMVEHLGPPF